MKREKELNQIETLNVETNTTYNSEEIDALITDTKKTLGNDYEVFNSCCLSINFCFKKYSKHFLIAILYT